MFNELDERNHDGGAGIERQEPHLPIGSRGSLDARPRTGQQDNKASTHGSTLDAIAEAELLRATCEDVSSGCIYSAYNRRERERSLSLSLIFITRVAPHCVNTLMILHAAHTLMMSAG